MVEHADLLAELNISSAISNLFSIKKKKKKTENT